MDGAQENNWVDAEGPAASRNARRLRLRPRRPELITSAQRTPEQNRHSREVKYLVLQLLRVPFILISITLAFFHFWWLGALFFALSIPMPWIAVVIANGRGEPRDKRTQNVYKPAAARQMAAEAARRAELEPGGNTSEVPATIDHEPDVPDGKEHRSD